MSAEKSAFKWKIELEGTAIGTQEEASAQANKALEKALKQMLSGKFKWNVDYQDHDVLEESITTRFSPLGVAKLHLRIDRGSSHHFLIRSMLRNVFGGDK